MSDVKVGNIVTFGTYEQDNNLANGKEPIKWRVLAVSGGKALLLSDKSLDSKPYNTVDESVTWATCTLRAWLNKDFMSAAFTAAEASIISLTSVTNPDNFKWGTSGGAITKDKVFLLSIGEANGYFSTDISRISLITAYASVQGWGYDIFYNKEGSYYWWLRSPGGNYYDAAIVGYDGHVFVFGNDVTIGVYAVRPALWLNLES